jgi:hypothetical protein
MCSRQSLAINIGQTTQIAREFFNRIGRPLPAVDVGCLGAQIGGRLSGGDFDGVAVAGRPIGHIRWPDFVAKKLSADAV